MTLREINDICIAKINGTMGEAEIPKEFWENVGRLANDLVSQEWREKQTPKKPKKVTLDTYDFTTYYVCPTCNTHDSGCKAPYCRWCGQKLDWNEYE